MARKGPRLAFPGGLPRRRFLPRARATPTPPSSLARGATAGPELPGRPLHLIVAFALGGAARQHRPLRPTAAHRRPRPVPRRGAIGPACLHPGSLGPCAGRASLEARTPHVGADPADDGAAELPRLLRFRQGRRQPLGRRAAADRGRYRHRPVRQRGTVPLVQDVVAGRVLMTIDSPVVLIPLVCCGARNAPDATHGQRIAKLPEMPAAPETLPDFQATVINDLAVHGGTPTRTSEHLNRTLGWAVASAATERRYAGTASPQDGSPQRTPGRLPAEEHEEWRALVTHAGTRTEKEGSSS
jgi:Tripartite tricarboxylate transporter family receptor